MEDGTMGSTHVAFFRYFWDNFPGIGWWLVFFVSLIIYSQVVNGLWRNEKTRTAGYWLKGLFWTFWGLLLLWKFGLFGNLHFNTSNTNNQRPGVGFSWAKFFWCLGLSGVVLVLFRLGQRGFKNLFIDKRHLGKDKSGEQPNTTASFCGLILTAICGLMIIWLPGMWLISLLLLICAWILSGFGAGRLNEVMVPSMFNSLLRDNSDILSRARGVKMLREGIFWSARPWWLIGYQLTRIRNDDEVINDHAVSSKLSTRGNGSDPGPRVSVRLNIGWRYGEWPLAFIKLTPEDQVDLKGAVLAAVDAFTQMYVRTVAYQDIENWKPDVQSDFFKELRKCLRKLGVELLTFDVVNVESDVEKKTDELADEQINQQIADLITDRSNERALRTAEAKNRALDVRVDGFLRVLGFDPSIATPEQRRLAVVEMQRVTVADKDGYLVPPNLGGNQNPGIGLNVSVQQPPRNS